MTLALAQVPQPLKLNLGCGKDLRLGWLNVDIYGQVDYIYDLNKKPWPWSGDSVSEVMMHHVLEHLPDTIGVMKEIYRVCRHGAKVFIAVPHPRHDDYVSDPTHVSPITIRMFELFSRKICESRIKDANNPLALIHGVDFEKVEDAYVVEEQWMAKVTSGQMTEGQLREAILMHNNVVKQIEITLEVRKAA